MKKIIMMAAIAVCMLGMDATAQTVHRGDRRMVAGNRNNSFTMQEMRQINFLKRELQRDIMRAKADGIVTFREKMMIDRKKKQLDRMIFMQKRDGRQRGF